MRQLINYVQDGTLHLAVADTEADPDEPGLTSVFQCVWPDGYGVHEAAVLGTNMVSFLQLDGRKRKVNGHGQLVPTKRAALPPADKPSLFDEDEREPEHETPAERKRRVARESYHRNKGTGTGRGKRSPTYGQGTDRYISHEEVMLVVMAHPEGIIQNEIADVIWRKDHPDADQTPHWVKVAVNNRFVHMRQQAAKGNITLPYRQEQRARIGKDGTPTKLMNSVILPI